MRENERDMQITNTMKNNKKLIFAFIVKEMDDRIISQNK